MLNLNRTLILGHRGARGEMLENTLSGFEHAQSLQPYGLSGVEFDVQLSADGQLIVFHDESLERMCGAQSRVDQLNLVEINRYVQSGHPIITLPDVATFSHVLADFATIELEIKTHGRTNYETLVTALARDLSDGSLSSLPIVLTSFDVQLLAYIQRHKLLTHRPRGLLIQSSKTLRQAPNTARQLGCCQLGIFYPLLTPAVVERCHRYDLSISAWTVNKIALIKKLIAWHVDAVITDFPTRVLMPPMS